MFCAYLASVNVEFVDAIKDERMQWTQGKLGAAYTYLDLMELGRLMYNNLVDEEYWSSKMLKSKEEEKNYLTLATEMITKFNRNRGDSGGSSGGQKSRNQNEGSRTYLPWRFENKYNQSKKDHNEIPMIWCDNDCHAKPMWCGRKNCLNRSDFAKEWEKKKKAKGTRANNNSNVSSEFKISLVAITSPEDFKVLQEQFGLIKD